MWQRFTQEEGANSPNKHKLEVYRKNNFANTVERIVNHNSDASSTYKKGIN